MLEGFQANAFQDSAFQIMYRSFIITMAPMRQWLTIGVRGTQYLEITPKLRQWLSIIWRR